MNRGLKRKAIQDDQSSEQVATRYKLRNGGNIFRSKQVGKPKSAGAKGDMAQKLLTKKAISIIKYEVDRLLMVSAWVASSLVNLHDPLRCLIHGDYWIKDHVRVGEEVMIHWKDGLNYVGNILQVVGNMGIARVMFDDHSIETVPLGWIHPSQAYITKDQTCNWCKGVSSEADIIFCDECNRGFHPDCHLPKIASPSLEFTCRWCTLSLIQPTEKQIKIPTPLMKKVKETKMTFPYDLKTLNWIENSFANQEDRYCYCGGGGYPDQEMMVQCRGCQMMFHFPCLNPLTRWIIGSLVPGDGYYRFHCGVCRTDGTESFRRIPMKWIQITDLALYNLALDHQDKEYFNVQEIVSKIRMIRQSGTRLFNGGKVAYHRIENKIVSILMANADTFQVNSPRKEWKLIQRQKDVPTH